MKFMALSLKKELKVSEFERNLHYIELNRNRLK